MATKYIVSTTGYIFPLTHNHIVLPKEKFLDGEFYHRRTKVTTYSEISDYIENNDIYYSHTANQAYYTYQSDKSFSNYMSLVDIAIEVLSAVDFDKFFAIQSVNRNMSSSNFMFCLDIYKGIFPETYKSYMSLPLSGRFVSGEEVTDKMITSNIQKCKLVKGDHNRKWSYELANIISDKSAFLVLFRQLFVDETRV